MDQIIAAFIILIGLFYVGDKIADAIRGLPGWKKPKE